MIWELLLRQQPVDEMLLQRGGVGVWRFVDDLRGRVQIDTAALADRAHELFMVRREQPRPLLALLRRHLRFRERVRGRLVRRYLHEIGLDADAGQAVREEQSGRRETQWPHQAGGHQEDLVACVRQVVGPGVEERRPRDYALVPAAQIRNKHSQVLRTDHRLLTRPHANPYPLGPTTASHPPYSS